MTQPAPRDTTILEVAQLAFGDEGEMRDTTVEGTVENGQIKLPANVRLPEHAKVLVIVPGIEEQPAIDTGSPRLAHPEQAADFEKEFIEESPDGSL